MLTWIYVGLVHAVAPVGRHVDRNRPHVAKRRMVACVAVAILAGWTTVRHQHGSNGGVLERLGMRGDRMVPSALAGGGLTAVLFAGPIAMKWPLPPPQALDALVIRNLLIAPLCEEFVFRACMITLLREEGAGTIQAVLLAPLFFGAAHLHHLYELMVFHKVGLATGLAQVGFQFAYTCIFGWFAAYLFLATRSIAGSVVAHQMCNYLGFPDFWAISRHPRKKLVLSLLAAGIPAFFYLLAQVHSV